MKKVADPVTAPLPVPEPADIDRAGAVMFDDLTADLKKLEKQLKGMRPASILHDAHPRARADENSFDRSLTP